MLYAQTYGLLLWLRADMGIQYGATMRAGGPAPPAWTLSGTATRQVNIQANIDSVAGGTALGQATYRWRENENAAYTSGVVTAAGPTALGTTGLLVAMAAGPYDINNTWAITVAQWNDQSGLGNHAVQLTAANQPLFSLAGFGGYSCVDWGNGPAGRKLDTPSVDLQAFSFLVAYRGDSGSGHPIVHNVDAGANGGYIWRETLATSVIRGGVRTGKAVASGWGADAVRRTVAMTYNGTHATNLLYKNGAPVTTTDVFVADPGLATATGPLYIGAQQGGTQGLRGVIREEQVWASPLPPEVVLALHNGMAARAPWAM
jgi:hypothetical protein